MKHVIDFRHLDTTIIEALEPMLDWSDLEKAAQARQALEANRIERNRRDAMKETKE
jgi:hypothetical protein